jgi:outer membrane lipoprotein-sorting protein
VEKALIRSWQPPPRDFQSAGEAGLVLRFQKGLGAKFLGIEVLLKRVKLSFFMAALAIVLCGMVPVIRARQAPGKTTVESVLGMMDKSSEDFKSLTADIEHVKYTAVVKDTSTETGQIYVRKDEKLRIDFLKPDQRTILRNGDNLYIYTPKINRVEEYNIGKNRAMADQYLALGFGKKGESIRKTYKVTLVGEEELDGHKTAVLELIPNSEDVRKEITKIQMWVDEASWLPVQQKFFEGSSGDYFLSRYKNMMKNLKVGDSRFKPDWPKGTKVEKPRG